MNRQPRRAMFAIIHAIALIGTTLPAAEPAVGQWRAAGRDGHLGVGTVPESLPQELLRQWSADIGAGHASPLIADGRAYTFSRQADQEAVACYALADGRPVWRQTYPAPYKVHSAAQAHGAGPKSTPVLANGRLFTLGISGILSAWNAESGKRLWQQSFDQQFPTTSPLYGTAMSPLVDGDRLIVHIGGHDHGALCALDVATGALRWRWAEDGPAYTSPLVVELAGRRQVITQTQQFCLGLAADSGKLLWKVPFRTRFDQNAVTPVLAGDLVIFGGYQEPTFALRLVADGDQLQPHEVWRATDIPLYMSTPVVVEGRLYGMTQRSAGQLFCADAKTGEVRWRGPPRLGENAALWTDGRRLLVLTTQGELLIVAVNAAEYQLLRRYTLSDSPTWAHPAVTRQGVLIKDAETLSWWRWQ